MNFESTKLNKTPWQLKIDVGGTFTDYIAVSPEGITSTGKILSSGSLRLRLKVIDSKKLQSDMFSDFCENFFKGFKIKTLGNRESEIHKIKSSANSQIIIEDDISTSGWVDCELYTGEEAPVMVARLETQTGLSGEFPPIKLNLGTTRGTNALLERKGARVGLVCNKGFKDVWEIGNQTRDDLFKLNISRPDSLASSRFELVGRIDSAGQEIEELNTRQFKELVNQFKNEKVEAIAICLLNSYVNPEHEIAVAEELRKHFKYVIESHKVTRTVKLLERGDTALVDAYLTPIIHSYVKSIQNSIPAAEIKLITSFGGLVPPENFSGKDSLLSGPAGGVNGFTHAALSAGFEKSIGFDMGGTSTDVKRYGGEFEYHFETVKAGVRVVTPMFAIETVAAGGGSICHFDGQRFLVGPESAGASPGPACYGAGGPLTVTDINLFNGKIDPEAFPFELNLKVVKSKLVDIQKAVEKTQGRKMSLEEIADGFSRIADFKMAEAIKKISSSKGYDPSGHLLVAFGGAGPQHACSIATLLGMKSILVHPYSGILSAYGIGLTGMQLFEERSILQGFSESENFLRDEISEMKGSLMEKAGKEPGEDLNFKVSLDLRYSGESDSITVDFEEAVKKFEEKHRQFYGYLHEGRGIEVVKLRIKASSQGDVIAVTPKVNSANSSSKTKQDLWVRGVKHEADLIDRADLKPGEQISGPTVIREGLSTIVVEPGWTAEVKQSLDLIINHTSSANENIIEGRIEKDPVKLELFNNLFTSIATRMGETLRRISLSVNIKERLDFSCAVLNSRGELIVNAPHIPVHLGAVSDSVKALLNEVKDLKPGMVFLTNDPGAGGSHLPDLTVMSPVFDEKNELMFFTASRAHHAEIGGVKPGSFYPFAKSIEEEGVVFKNFLLADKDGFKADELREYLISARYPSRNPEENIADLKAAVAAGRYGQNELISVIEDFGKDLVLAYMDFMCQSAEEKTADIISSMNIEESEFVDEFDDGTPLKVKVRKTGKRLKIDFKGTGPVNQMTMNANVSIVKSAVLFVLRSLINEEIPLNAGVLKNIDLVVPESLLNPPPAKKAAVSAGNVEVSQKICDVLFAALGVSAASQGTMNNIIFGNERFGFYETLGGGAGAGKGYDGVSGIHTNMTNTRLTDAEIIEKAFPVRIEYFGYRKGSGGGGNHKGGEGLIRAYRFLTNLELSLVTQRRVSQPFGLNGGISGARGENRLKKVNGKVEELPSLCQVSVNNGDLLEILTPGGGGWGEMSS